MFYRSQAVYISTYTRPDITFAVNQLVQTKPSEADYPDFKRLDQIFKRLKEKQYGLRYGHINLETAEIQVFSDASFGNNKDLLSQIEYMILWVDAKHNCSILSWSSTNCKRVTRSVLDAKLYELAHGYDTGFVMAHTVGKLLNRPMKIRVFTDSRTLFDSIVSLCTIAEKRLMIHIFCPREAYRRGKLANLGWIRLQHNFGADVNTKDLKNSALNDVFRSSTIKTPVQQGVEKGPVISNH